MDEHDRDDRHTWIAALYFCAVTILTVGYGDVRPTTTAGKLYVIFFILVAACLASVLLSRVAERIPDPDRASRIISRKKERVMRVDVAKLRERIRSNRGPFAVAASKPVDPTTTRRPARRNSIARRTTPRRRRRKTPSGKTDPNTSSPKR